MSNSVSSEITESKKPNSLVSKQCIFATIAVTSVALVLSAVVSAILYKPVSSGEQKTQLVLYNRESVLVCDTLQCKMVAENLLKRLNTSTDPCNNFLNYVCGGRRHNSSENQNQSKVPTENVMSKLKITHLATSFLNANNVNDTSVIKGVKKFFRKCLTRKATAEQERSGLKTVIRDFGGFPMFTDQSYNRTFSWVRRSAKVIRQFGIYDDGFVQGILLNFFMNDQSELVISKPTLHDFSLNSTLIQKSLCTVLKPSYNEKERKVMAIQIEDLVSFRRKIVVFASAKDDSEEVMQIADFEEKFPDVHAYEFLTEVFLDTGMALSKNTPIHVKHLEFWKNMNQLLRTTKSETIDNAIGLSNFEILQYTSSPRILLKTYKYLSAETNAQERYGTDANCFMWTDIAFKYAMARLVADNAYNGDVKEKVCNAVTMFQKALTRLIGHNVWMSEDTKRLALEKIKMIQLNIGFPNWIKNDAALTKYYTTNDQLESVNGSFVEILRKMLTFNTKEKLFQMRNKLNDDWQKVSLVVPLSKPNYNPTMNSITLPFTYCVPPLFWTNATSTLTFSSAFLTVGKPMLKSISGIGSKFDVYGNKKKWWDEETRMKFNNTVDCMRKRRTYDDEVSLADDLENSGGLRMAYRAYTLSGHDDHRLPGLQYFDDKRLFFISAGKSLCVDYASEGRDAKNWTVVNKFTRSLNVQEFAKSFKCLLGSKMNKRTKCPVW